MENKIGGKGSEKIEQGKGDRESGLLLCWRAREDLINDI